MNLTHPQKFRRYFEIIRELALTDFKGKYKNSVLGFFWSFLNPLLMFSVLYLVFTFFFKLKVEHYQLYLLLGVIIWSYFSEATVSGIESLVFKKGLITKIAFPPEVIVIGASLTSALTFFLNLLIFLGFMFFSGIFLSPEAGYFLIIYLELFLLILGLNFAMSALYVRYRDLSHIWGVLLQIGFWATPIVYPLELVPQAFLKYYMLNPVARLIHTSRTVFLYHYLASFKDLLITFLEVFLIFMAGYLIFAKEKKFFAERV